MIGEDSVRSFGRYDAPGQQPRQIDFVDRPGSAQSVIKAVFPVTLKPNDKMAISAQVLNTILGGGVFNARFDAEPARSPCHTYGAYSSLDCRRCAALSAPVAVCATK